MPVSAISLFLPLQ